MKTLLTALIDFFTVDPYDRQRKIEHDYLSQATDLVDLERRQRRLMDSNPNLKGWV